jgi:hypothetical protein
VTNIRLHTVGIPSRTQILSLYAELSNSRKHSSVVSELSLAELNQWSGFYLAFLFFKNCVIVHGVAQRASLGVASSGSARKVASLLPSMVKITYKILDELPPPPQPDTQTKTRSKL